MFLTIFDPLIGLIPSIIILTIVSAALAEPIDEKRAITYASQNNPTLHAAILDLKAAQQDVRANEATYTTVLQVTPSFTHSEIPNATVEGLRTGSSDTFDLGVGISHQFAWGTEVSLGVSGNSKISRVTEPTTSVMARLGPNYGLQAQVSLTQPLLRNAGLDVGEADLRIAHTKLTKAEIAKERTASELLRDVLISYWDLWYSQSALQVYQRDRDLAEKQYKEAKDRAEIGTVAISDTLSFETQLASLEETLVESEVSHQGYAIELGRLMGLEPERSIQLLTLPPHTIPLEPIKKEQAVQVVKKASQELRELQAELQVAREQYKLADDATEARLDLNTRLSAQGLGQQDLIDPLEQVGKLAAISGYAGLTFELPFSNAKRNSQLAQVAMTLRAAQERYLARSQQIEADTTKQVDLIEANQRRVSLAEHTVTVAQKLAEVERQRLELGTTTPLQVLQAQEDFRNAELRLAKAKLEQAKARIVLLHLTAQLFPRYADIVK